LTRDGRWRARCRKSGTAGSGRAPPEKDLHHRHLAGGLPVLRLPDWCADACACLALWPALWRPAGRGPVRDDGFMRAARLINLVLLLQARGTLTASELARELEVSERRCTAMWWRCPRLAFRCTPSRAAVAGIG
jgi:hypothetical protein